MLGWALVIYMGYEYIGWTKARSSDNLRNPLTGDTFRIVTADTKKEIRENPPAPKHYIVYPETIQGRGGGFGHWRAAKNPRGATFAMTNGVGM